MYSERIKKDLMGNFNLFHTQDFRSAPSAGSQVNPGFF